MDLEEKAGFEREVRAGWTLSPGMSWGAGLVAVCISHRFAEGNTRDFLEKLHIDKRYK